MNSIPTLSEMTATALDLTRQELADKPGRRTDAILTSLELAWWWAARVDQGNVFPPEALNPELRFPMDNPNDLSSRLANLSRAAKAALFWLQDNPNRLDMFFREEFFAFVRHVGDALGMLYRMRDEDEV